MREDLGGKGEKAVKDPSGTSLFHPGALSDHSGCCQSPMPHLIFSYLTLPPAPIPGKPTPLSLEYKSSFPRALWVELRVHCSSLESPVWSTGCGAGPVRATVPLISVTTASFQLSACLRLSS